MRVPVEVWRAIDRSSRHRRLHVRQPYQCKKKPLSILLSFPLCLSRACLGKMIIFSINWREIGIFVPG